MQAPPVSVLVDARGLYQSGIGRYLRAILRHIVVDPRFGSIALVGDPDQIEEFAASHRVAARIDVIPFAYSFYSPGAQADWWRLRVLGRLRSDVSFFPHYNVPLWPGVEQSVVTVQDLTHFRLAQHYPHWKRVIAGHVLSNAVRGATRVLVSSRSTRSDLLARHPRIASKVSIIPLGVDEGFAREPKAECVGTTAIAGLRPFLLCVGNRKPNKNLGVAVEVLAELRSRGYELRLILAGQNFKEGDAVSERARALGVESSIIEVGAVSDAELRGLYSEAECLLFPSLYEGFGLPPLEAMSLGLPVVAADRASTPEVVETAGVLVEPTGPAMAGAVRRILDNSEWRRELIRRGIERARVLTWERTAAGTADVLWEVGLQSPRLHQSQSELGPAALSA